MVQSSAVVALIAGVLSTVSTCFVILSTEKQIYKMWCVPLNNRTYKSYKRQGELNDLDRKKTASHGTTSVSNAIRKLNESTAPVVVWDHSDRI